MSSRNEVVEFEFFQRISTQKGIYGLDFHKVSKNDVVVAYRVVIYAFNREDTVVFIKKQNDKYLFTIEEGEVDDEMRKSISNVLDNKL